MYQVCMLRTMILVCCMTALTAGCSSYQSEPLSAAANATDLEGRTLSDPRLRTFVLASLAPQTVLPRQPSWDLTTLTLAAVYYNPDLDIARAKLTLAQAGVITAKQRPNPTLNFTSIFSQAVVAGAIPAGAAPLTIGPVINFIIETFDKREDRTVQAQQLALAARWDLATAGWQVRGRVRTALLNLWAARERMILNRQRLALEEQLVGLLERRFAMGEASALDVTRERINRAQIALAIRDVERAEAEARTQLATAIGVSVRALDGVDLALGGFDRPQPVAENLATGELRRRALTVRTDVRGALSEYEASQAALKLQIANQYPNVTLGPGYNYDLGDNKYIFGLGADLPIFNQNQGPIAEAVARRSQAAAAVTQLQASIIGAIDQAAAAYRAAAQSVATADALLADQQRRQGQIQRSFGAGEVDRPTLVTADLESAVIRLSRFDAVLLKLQATGALEDALQQPLFDPDATLFVPPANPRPALEPSS